MKILLIALLTFSALATSEINLNNRSVALGHLGDINNPNDFNTLSVFKLKRTEATPKTVRLNFTAMGTKRVCVDTQTRTYPCYDNNGPYGRRCWVDRYGNRVCGNRGGWGYGNGHPGYGMCVSTYCAKYKEVPAKLYFTSKLKFRKAKKLANNASELIDFKLTSATKNSYGIKTSVLSDDNYIIKLRGNRVIYKLAE